jgi:4a-hydroxytetrahydrobiopterin dehydratase
LPVLKDSEIRDALQSLPEWYLSRDTLRRDYQFKSFMEAMSFVNRVAEVAETANHHPDIDIRYNKVTLALTSHDSGGITQRDLRMAKKISEMKEMK